MARILLIESSASVCSVALSADGKVISIREDATGNKHAELLSVFCDEVLKEAGLTPAQLDAVAVSGGPGSYTGLRIGTSTAKGYCFALGIPLIAIPTLEAMALGMQNEAAPGDLLCPMIDARRMEVYSSVFTKDISTVEATAAVVIDKDSYRQYLEKSVVWFSGDGMPKTQEVLSLHSNARFTNSGMQSAKNMAGAAERKFLSGSFEDLAYYVPFYLKNFQPGPKRSQA